MALDILDPRVVDAAANGNFKATLDLSTQTTQQMGINQQGHANRLDRISESVMTEALGQRAGMDVSEAAAVAPIAALSDTLAASIAQAIVKAVQTINPQTGTVG